MCSFFGESFQQGCHEGVMFGWLKVAKGFVAFRNSCLVRDFRDPELRDFRDPEFACIPMS